MRIRPPAPINTSSCMEFPHGTRTGVIAPSLSSPLLREIDHVHFEQSPILANKDYKIMQIFRDSNSRRYKCVNWFENSRITFQRFAHLWKQQVWISVDLTPLLRLDNDFTLIWIQFTFVDNCIEYIQDWLLLFCTLIFTSAKRSVNISNASTK